MITKVMFTGDSVTDAGHVRPVGDGTSEVGNGYVGNLITWAWADYPMMHVRIQNSAISGDTSVKLLRRFDTDVIGYRPDVLYILIGINDARRFFDDNMVKTEYQIPVEQTAENLKTMILKCTEAGIRPVVISPLYFDPDKKEPIRKIRDRYEECYRKVCEETGTEYLDVQKTIDAYMKNGSMYMLSDDRIHPKAVANVLIAKTIYQSKSFRNLLKEDKGEK